MNWVLLSILILSGCAGAPNISNEEVLQAPQEISPEEYWGIQIESLRLTAADRMLDFRYRVTDPIKAAAVFDRQNKAYLIDQATGATLGVPRTAKVGPLRQTNFEPEPKRVYFILFSNHAAVVKPGNLVTVVVGDCRFENVTVQ